VNSRFFVVAWLNALEDNFVRAARDFRTLKEEKRSGGDRIRDLRQNVAQFSALRTRTGC